MRAAGKCETRVVHKGASEVKLGRKAWTVGSSWEGDWGERPRDEVLQISQGKGKQAPPVTSPAEGLPGWAGAASFLEAEFGRREFPLIFILLRGFPSPA